MKGLIFALGFSLFCWLLVLLFILAIRVPLSFGDSKPPTIPPQRNTTILIDRNRYMPRYVANSVVQKVVSSMPLRFPYRVRTSPRHDCYRWVQEKSDMGSRILQLRCLHGARKDIRGRVLWLSEPLIESGILYTAGLANGICNPNASALCNVTRVNQSGINREEYARVTCSHELAHLFGARHDNAENPPSIMHENALHFADSMTLGFSQRSRAQIWSCRQ